MFKPRSFRHFRADSEEADDIDIFSRSEETLKRARAQQEAERAQKRQKQLAKQLEADRKGKEPAVASTVVLSPKRRKVDDDGDYVESIEGKPSAKHPRHGDVLNDSSTPPVRQSPRRTKSRIITIDDSEEEEAAPLVSPNNNLKHPAITSEPTKTPPVPADEDDSDAEIRALAARSRARKAAAAAEQARLLQGSKSTLARLPATATMAHDTQSTQSTSVPSTADPVQKLHSDSRSKEIPLSVNTVTSSSPDPVVSIFLHSRIPDTKPLIVNRRISQPLKAVRLAFCKTNHLPPALEASVFLTWRRRRLFDITTCKSLDIDVDAHTGEIYVKGDRHGGLLNTRSRSDSDGEDDGTDDDSGPAKLEMEVLTQAIYDADRQALQAKLRGTPTDATNTASDTAIPAERRVKIILRGPGYDDYKLTVKPTTLFSQIVSAFRRQRAVPDDKAIHLMFDGERLAEADSVGASDIDDMDFVNVHVK